MAKKKVKKVVTTSTGKKTKTVSTAKKVAVRKSESASSARKSQINLFGKENYKWMFIGIGLIALGLVLMSGGSMPDENTWDPDRIYSFRRITLAPIVIIAGLGLQVVAIFKK